MTARDGTFAVGPEGQYTGTWQKPSHGGSFAKETDGTGSVIKYFRMRGVDNGTSHYTTWTALAAPDPNGAQATGGNTTPTLVGAIVAASGIVLAAWQA